MTKPQSIAVVVGLVVVLALAIASLVNSARMPAITRTPEAQFAVGQSAYRQLQQRPFVFAETSNAVPNARDRSAWRADAALFARELALAEVSGLGEVAADGVDVSNDTINALVQLVSEFLHASFGQPDPDVYLAWLRETGHRLRTDAEWEPWGGRGAYEEFFTGEPARGDLSAEDSFRAVWAATAPTGPFAGGSPAAFAEPPAGMHIALGFGTRTIMFTGAVASENHLSFQEWHGGVAAACAMWFAPDRTRTQVLEHHDRVIAAQVAMVLTFADGSRHPWSTQWFIDPADGRWRLWAINVNNYTEGRGDICVAY